MPRARHAFNLCVQALAKRTEDAQEKASEIRSELAAARAELREITGVWDGHAFVAPASLHSALSQAQACLSLCVAVPSVMRHCAVVMINPGCHREGRLDITFDCVQHAALGVHVRVLHLKHKP